MTLEVFKNIIEGSSATLTSEGLQVTSIVTISGFDGNPTTVIADAVNFPGLPDLGEPHPRDPSSKVVRKQAEPIGRGQFRVTVDYAQEGEEPVDTFKPITQIGSTLITARTSEHFSVPNDNTRKETIKIKDEDPNERYKFITNTGEVDVQTPNLLMRFIKKEKNNPFSKAFKFTGSINSKPIFGVLSRTLLCKIDYEREGSEGDWLVTYEMQFRPETWDATLFVVDPSTGQIVENARPNGNRDRPFRVYRELDFTQLGINFDPSRSS